MVETGTIVLAIIIALASLIILSILFGPITDKFKCSCLGKKLSCGGVACGCAKDCGSCDNPNLVLLSKGKPAMVCPAWPSYPGSNLTDGDYGTFAHSADWISTSNVSAEVDLGQPYVIRKVKIFNRKDCCQSRFGYHKLIIDDQQVAEGDAKGSWEYEYCLNLQGQRVKILMDGILNLSEIEVWGYPIQQ
jgi:F5/8 type C domain.